MITGMGARLKRIAKVLFFLCAIELFLPGGTLIVLGYLLTGGRHIHTSSKAEGGLQTWGDIRGLVFARRRPTGVQGVKYRRSPGRTEMSWTWMWIGGSLVLGVCLGMTLMSLLVISRTRG
jgi:hypothetical protein